MDVIFKDFISKEPAGISKKEFLFVNSNFLFNVRPKELVV